MKEDNTFVIIVIILLALLLFGGFGMMGFGGFGYGGMMSGSYYGMMGGSYGFGFMWIFGWLLMMLSITALILFIIWLVKQLQTDNRRRND